MNYGLLAFDVELERGTIGTHVKGDRGAHHEGEVDVVMSSGETAQHRNVIGGQVGAKHRFNTLIVKFVAATDEFSKDDAFAAVEHTVHDQHVKQSVDVVHRFSHLFDEQDKVIGQRGIGLGAEIGGESAEVATYQHALSMSFTSCVTETPRWKAHSITPSRDSTSFGLVHVTHSDSTDSFSLQER